MQFGRLSLGRSRVVWMLALAIASVMFAAAAPASAAPPVAKKPSPPLTAQWWQSFVSIGGNALDRCDIGSGDVVFLAGTASGSATRSCTISSQQSILVPLINVECSTIEGNGDTPAELNKCARGFADQFTDLSLVIDGTPITNLTKFRVGSPVFSFTAAEGNVFGIPVGTTRSVADGYWALISPLPVGTHTISFGGAFPSGGFATSVTYTLTVQ
jgi:hypothetical protein